MPRLKMVDQSVSCLSFYMKLRLAMMMKYNSVIVGQKTPYNVLFIFCANGKRYKTLELDPLVSGLAQ